jgi:8-oxo-dGTP pyrophosphatase MutT (NUDIX family)
VTRKGFESFVEQLKLRLAEPLPGKKAQVEMAPRPIDERRFNENPERPPRKGGVMVLLYPDEGRIHVPLMKRPVYNGTHSGQVSFPGGAWEPMDIDLTHTALRETEEEIGIPQSAIEVLGHLSELFIIASNFKVLPTIGVVYEKPNFIPDPIEVARVLPMSLDVLYSEEQRKVKTMKFPPFTIHSPYYDVHGEVVWGATAMMLSELAAIMEQLIRK